MAKPTPAQMKAAVEAFKKKFTSGFYHGSPSPDIKEFDPTKSKKDPMYTTPKATFVTRDPEFAESFLSMNNSGKVKSGSTMYPVSVNLGQHWNPNTPEGQAVISQFIEQYPKRVNLEKGLKRGDWTAIENSDFLEHLKKTGHDTFHVVEGGIPNVGVLKPQNIRGKFAEFNPEEAANPDFMKAAGGAIKTAKKALEHAKSMPVFHYSKQPNLTELDPRFYGSKEGIKGQEARRLKDAQDIRNRSYFYVDVGENTMKPEQGLGPFKYQGVANDIYDLANDPAGYGAIAKIKALDPYMASMGREVIDPEIHANELERAIKAAGYGGYSNDKVGLTWNPLPVTRSE